MMENDDSRFDDLLKRYLKDEVTEEERKKIDAWLDSNKRRHGKKFVWKSDDEQALFEKISAKINNTDEVTSFTPRQKILERKIRRWLGVAAAIAAFAVACYFAWDLLEARRTQTDVIATNTQQKVMLADGSIVWLENGSKLSYYQDDRGRHATLDGQGLFEVAKNKARPFTVQCNAATILVTGTSFTVNTSADSFAVNVLTGIVLVALEKDTIALGRDEGIRYQKAGQAVKHVATDQAKLIRNTEYNMSFENIPMSDVMRRIEAKFAVELKAADARLERCRITADFTDRSLEGTLQMLSEVLDINFEINGAQVVITGAGCE